MQTLKLVNDFNAPSFNSIAQNMGLTQCAKYVQPQG
jgi:hypothetical protein